LKWLNTSDEENVKYWVDADHIACFCLVNWSLVQESRTLEEPDHWIHILLPIDIH
jgi:hypothetical protein